MLDQVVVDGEERPVSVQGNVFGHHLHAQAAAVGTEARAPVGLFGHALERVGEQPGMVRIAALPCGDHVDIQRQPDIAGNADLLAHQPGGIDDQRDRIARVERVGRADPYRQQVLALVAVVDQVAHLQCLGPRPPDLACDHAAWQLPVQRGRYPGIAGIDPVGVPVLVRFQTQSGPEGLARLDGAGLGDQFGPDVVTLDCAVLGRGPGQQRKQGQYCRQDSHHDGPGDLADPRAGAPTGCSMD
jgi:hypothetical protein